MILHVMRMCNFKRDNSLHVINIIKLKRMHGLNYLSFGEQTLLFLLLKHIDDIACHAHAQL